MGDQQGKGALINTGPMKGGDKGGGKGGPMDSGKGGMKGGPGPMGPGPGDPSDSSKGGEKGGFNPNGPTGQGGPPMEGHTRLMSPKVGPSNPPNSGTGGEAGPSNGPPVNASGLNPDAHEWRPSQALRKNKSRNIFKFKSFKAMSY